MLSWIVENSLVALALAALACAATLLLRARPAVCHLLWVLVLVRLIAPPIAGGELAEVGLGRFARETRAALWTPEEARVPAHPAADPAPSAPVPARALDEASVAWKSGARAELEHEDRASETDAEEGGGSPVPAPGSGGPSALGSPFGAEELLLGAWILGSTLVALRQIFAAVRFRALLRTGSEPSARLRAVVGEVAQQLGVRAPRIRVVEGVGSPLVWSLGRPLLAWPADAGGELAPNEPIVAHELAHLRRRDHWVAWLEVVALCVCWWNPLYWFVQRRLREQAELACDAWVVDLYPEHRRAYAESLIDAAERRSARPLAAPALGATDTTVQIFRRRLEMILRDRVSCRIPPAAGALAILCTLLALPSTSGTSARPTAQVPAEEPVAADPQLDALVETARARARAERAFQAGSWKAAAEAYRQLAALDAADGVARHRLGYALLAARDPREYSKAVNAFREQAELGHRVETAEYNIACALALSGDVENALEHLHRAVHAGFLELELLRTDADLDALRSDARFDEYAAEVAAHLALRKEAAAAFDAEEWKAAADAYTRLADALPTHGEARHRLGLAQLELGEYTAAAESFAVQARLDHDAPRAGMLAARALARAGESEQALAELERAVESGYSDYKILNVDSAFAMLREEPRFQALVEGVWSVEMAGREAYAAESAGDWETAAACYERVLEQRPEDGATCAKLGRALFRRGAYRDAIEAFTRQARHGHDSQAALYDLACAHAQLGEREAALADARRAIELGFVDAERMRLDPDLASLHGDAAFQQLVRLTADRSFLRKAGAADWDELLDRCADTIEREPANGKAHYQLGWAFLRLEAYDRAVEAFTRQDELGFAPGVARYNAACASALRGDLDAAFAWLERAAEIGFADAKLLAGDLDLAALRDDPRFARLLERLGGTGTAKAKDRAAEATAAKDTYRR